MKKVTRSYLKIRVVIEKRSFQLLSAALWTVCMLFYELYVNYHRYCHVHWCYWYLTVTAPLGNPTWWLWFRKLVWGLQWSCWRLSGAGAINPQRQHHFHPTHDRLSPQTNNFSILASPKNSFYERKPWATEFGHQMWSFWNCVGVSIF